MNHALFVLTNWTLVWGKQRLIVLVLSKLPQVYVWTNEMSGVRIVLGSCGLLLWIAPLHFSGWNAGSAHSTGLKTLQLWPHPE
jgi:hypothetical protein